MRPMCCAVAALSVLACTGTDDPMIERCSVVVEYRHPELRSLDIAVVRQSPFAVTLDYEGVNKETKEEFADRILCEFAPDERLKLSRIAIGGETLNDAEVTLANSELLLRDLGKDPEGS